MVMIDHCGLPCDRDEGNMKTWRQGECINYVVKEFDQVELVTFLFITFVCTVQDCKSLPSIPMSTARFLAFSTLIQSGTRSLWRV